jgi:cysteine desulfuration protein SufE
MNIEEKQNAIIEEFEIFDDWMDKYAYLIDLGNELEVFNPDERTEDNLIDGCQSKLWITVEYKDKKLFFNTDGDAIITKGIASLLIRVFNGETPKDILNSDLFFIDKIGLHQHLSPTRSNGLLEMLKRIKSYAAAYNTKYPS